MSNRQQEVLLTTFIKGDMPFQLALAKSRLHRKCTRIRRLMVPQQLGIQRFNAFRTLDGSQVAHVSKISRLVFDLKKKVLVLRNNSHGINFIISDLQSGSLCIYGLHESMYSCLQLPNFVPCHQR